MLPASFTSHSARGTCINSTATAATMIAGTAAAAISVHPSGAPGLASRSTTIADTTTRMPISIGFSTKGNVPIASPRLGRSGTSHMKSRTDSNEAERARERERDARCGPGGFTVGGQRANEIVGLHVSSRWRLAKAPSPRCSATRTAPSLMLKVCAATVIEAPSIAIARTTLR